jgi:hypothetical protein
MDTDRLIELLAIGFHRMPDIRLKPNRMRQMPPKQEKSYMECSSSLVGAKIHQKSSLMTGNVEEGRRKQPPSDYPDAEDEGFYFRFLKKHNNS